MKNFLRLLSTIRLKNETQRTLNLKLWLDSSTGRNIPLLEEMKIDL